MRRLARVYWSVISILIILVCATATAGSMSANERPLLDRSTEPFRIMNWWSPLRSNLTEEQIDLMVGCGFNFLKLMGYTPDNCKRALGYASKYPWVEAVVWDERMWSSQNMYDLSGIDSIVQDYRGYRAFRGFVVRDEPPVSEYGRLGAIFAKVREQYPGVVPYVNLLPNYGFPGDTRDRDYADYVAKYIALRPPMVCYDHYPFLADGQIAQLWFANLEEVRKQSQAAGLPSWAIVQFSAFDLMKALDQGELRWSVNSALVYGFKGICYFCYMSPPEPQLMPTAAIKVDGSVNPERYELLKSVNREIANLGPVLMVLTSRRVYHTDPLPPNTQGIPGDAWVQKVSGGEWVIGELQGQRGPYVMLVNRDPRHAQKTSVVWSPSVKEVYRISDRNLELKPVRLKKGSSGHESNIALEPGSGALFRLVFAE